MAHAMNIGDMLLRAWDEAQRLQALGKKRWRAPTVTPLYGLTWTSQQERVLQAQRKDLQDLHAVVSSLLTYPVNEVVGQCEVASMLIFRILQREEAQ